MAEFVLNKGPPKKGKKEGVSPAALTVALVIVVALAATVIVFMVLYFRKNATLIKPSECPEKITGLLVRPNQQINQLATNCGSQVDCTFQVASVQEAVDKCQSFGNSKCVSFTLKQVPNTDLYTMKISDSTDSSLDVGSDTYRVLE